MAFFGFGLAQQREVEQAIALLTEKQQTALTKAVNEATTDAERRTIIVNKMIEFAAENKASSKATIRTVYIVTGIVSLIMVSGVFYVWKKGL